MVSGSGVGFRRGFGVDFSSGFGVDFAEFLLRFLAGVFSGSGVSAEFTFPFEADVGLLEVAGVAEAFSRLRKGFNRSKNDGFFGFGVAVVAGVAEAVASGFAAFSLALEGVTLSGKTRAATNNEAMAASFFMVKVERLWFQPGLSIPNLACGAPRANSSAMKRFQFPLLAGLGFLVVFPFFLTRRFRVVRRLIIRAQPAAIYPFVADLRNWPLWVPALVQNEDALTFSREAQGPGALMHYEGCCCEGSVRIRHTRTDERVAFQIENGAAKGEMEGIISLEAVDEMTRVTLLCTWPAHQNPLARYLDLGRKMWLKRETAAGLAALQSLVETEA